MTTPYIDPNLIFAENAPVQDKPAAFQNYDKGWDGSRKNDGRPLIPQMNYLTQQSDLKNLYIHENGAALPYKDGIAYEENAVVVKDGVLQQWKGGVWVGVVAKTDADISTWSGRTQEAKNKESVSPLDYNAPIDGVTDATAAFAALESNFSGTAVDLLGKTYKVSAQPIANKYFNGKFLIGSTLIDLSMINKSDLTDSATNLKTEFNLKFSELNNTVSVQHYRENGFIYDVISNIHPSQLQAISNRSNPANPLMTRLTAKEAAKKYNKSVLVNCSAFKNASGAQGWNEATLLPNGIYIEDGQVVTDWSYSNNIARNQACCLMNTGELKRFYRESTTAQQMVDQGALIGFSWGAWCVYNSTTPSDFGAAPINDGTKSARTLIMQMPNNTISLLLIEGVSKSYGATAAEAASIALSLGVKSAFIIESGGSTQCWWGNTYAVPSSDETTRTLPCYLAINTPAVNVYDSGIVPIAHNPAFGNTVVDSTRPPLYLRQVGDEITLQANIGTAITETSQNLTDGNALPARYNTTSSSISRGVCLGGGGRMFRLYQEGGANFGQFVVQSVNQELKPTTVTGSLKWFTKHI